MFQKDRPIWKHYISGLGSIFLKHPVISSGNTFLPGIYWEYVSLGCKKNLHSICFLLFYSSTCKKTTSLNVLLWKLLFCLSFQNNFHSSYSWIYRSRTEGKPHWQGEGVERPNAILLLFILRCIRHIECFPRHSLVWWLIMRSTRNENQHKTHSLR